MMPKILLYIYRLADLHMEFGVDKHFTGQNVLTSRSGKKGDIYDLVSNRLITVVGILKSYLHGACKLQVVRSKTS